MSTRNSKNGAKTPMRKCPVTHHTTDQEDFEHDFTTQGRIGNLECPFAKMAANNNLPHTPESDPIAAEFHADQASVTSPTTASGAVGRCPIRFLDKHSPEEIAKYFENHKHELPRSHQVCVQRYQRNEAGAKELDAKYGNMVNMIQGLGVKHKQYLPGSERPSKQEASSSGAAVEKWAEDVSASGEDLKAEVEVEEDEARVSHFERPLREIRVGESPSRPWGISVPVVKEIPPSAMASEAAGPAPAPTTSAIHHQASPGPGVNDTTHNETRNIPRKSSQLGHSKPNTSDKPSSSTPPTHQVIFNGPVFFGYSPDQAAAFLQMLTSSGSNPNGS